MKKATRLLILTAFVFPILMTSRAYAGGPGPGPRVNFGERERLGIDQFGTHNTDPFINDDHTTDGFHATTPDDNPLHLLDPIGDPRPDIDRNNLFDHGVFGDHNPFPGAGHPAWDPSASGNGGGTAPIDGGISLLLAAGLGLGIKRARARKQTV